MKLIYYSEEIKSPEVYLINKMRENIDELDINTTDDCDDYIISLSPQLFDVYLSEIGGCMENNPLLQFRGIECIKDLAIKGSTWCIYKMSNRRPTNKEPLTLNDWFNSLSLTERNWCYNRWKNQYQTIPQVEIRTIDYTSLDKK